MSNSPLAVDAAIHGKRLRRVRLPSSVTDAKVAWKTATFYGKAKCKRLSRERRRHRYEKFEEDAPSSQSPTPAIASQSEDDWVNVDDPQKSTGQLLQLFIKAKRWLMSLW